eukprot:tig00001384_g8559.t1
MASSERPSKRATAELEDGSPPPTASNAPDATGLSLEQLPGDLLSRILQLLPLKEAFRVREVSRALRDAVEGTAFDGAKLDLDDMRTEELDVLERLRVTWKLDALERLVRNGRLKGSELSVSVECEWAPSSLAIGAGAQPLRLLAALAGRCRSVHVNFAEPYDVKQLVQRHGREHIVGQRVADVLAALAPGGAAGPLQELQLHGNSEQAFCQQALGSGVLEIPAELLAPFSKLRALLLPDLPLSVGTAAAIAARLPTLRSLQLFYGEDQRGVLRRLGPLCLERLVLRTAPGLQGDDSGVGLAELSGTPLGRSLRELRLEGLGPQFGSPPGPRLSADDLHALSDMPRLEAVAGLVRFLEDIGGAVSRGLQSLLRAPRLSVLQLSLLGGGWSAAFSAVLAAALAAGPLPSRLALDLRVSPFEIAQIVDAGAGPVLRNVDVDLYSSSAGAAAAVSAALLRCPRLESLVLRAAVRSAEDIAALAAGFAPLAALPPLPGGLRLEVEVLGSHEQFAKESLSAALPAAALDINGGES